ncbi:MAG: tRNA pseudouridine synthase Pus10 [Methanocella sp. PtaU1.Bin125]|nr:MAG: tRNA pseudouridine synthase Pus10 [Methanocella sp. PtaU1.Bin125]
MTILDTARRILKEGPICDPCMGRQFAKLSTGLTNAQRGNAIKLALSMQAAADDDKQTQRELAPTLPQARKLVGGEEEECWLCRGLFQKPERLQEYADRCVAAAQGYEYDTILVGTKVPPLMSEKEEVLQAECGITHAEPLKSELNREVGKLVSQMTGKDVDFGRPDVLFTIDLAAEKVEMKANSLFVYGRYNKYVRDIPQTRWPCRECKGKGCERCNNTGKMYPVSVEELINHAAIETFGAADGVLHGAGREDIDAFMLGDGRPFVMEMIAPRVRKVDLKALEERINAHAMPRVRVNDLVYVDKAAVEEVKSMKVNKVYRLKVIYNEDISIETLKSSLAALTDAEILQRTPERVAHRRADLERKRRVFGTALEQVDEEHKYFVMTVRCEGGLYVKELVSGDQGRTRPSLSGLVGQPLKVQELDVIKVEGGISWQDHTVKGRKQDTSSTRT